MLSKQVVLQSFKDLPDSFSLEEAIDQLILLQKIEKGLAQSFSEEVVSSEDAKKRLAKWLK